MKPKLSIIIPTFNEEVHLPKLLKSIKEQEYKNYEVIVADNNSKDRTRKIAKQYGATIVDGVLPGAARNNGAKFSKGNILLFLDSDVILEEDFLKKAISDFEKRNLGIAISGIRTDSKQFIDKVLYRIADLFLKTIQYFKVHGAGCCGIMVKKNIHEKINGFNEGMYFGEDTDYISRASKYGKFRVLKTKLYISARRFEVEGRLNLALKYIKSTLYNLIGKSTDGVEYNFDIYKNLKK